MIIVIDAYNLLCSVPPYKKTVTDKERAWFIKNLGIYGQRKGHKIIIVFDGGPYEWPFKENRKTVTVIYSGIHESADDYIKDYMQVHYAKDLLLVSSDTELNRSADHYKIPSIDSSAFYQLLHQELFIKKDVVVSHHQEVKLMHDDTEHIDDFMLQASKNVPIKSEDFIKDQSLKKQQVSKHERALLKKLHKL